MVELKLPCVALRAKGQKCGSAKCGSASSEVRNRKRDAAIISDSGNTTAQSTWTLRGPDSRSKPRKPRFVLHKPGLLQSLSSWRNGQWTFPEFPAIPLGKCTSNSCPTWPRFSQNHDEARRKPAFSVSKMLFGAFLTPPLDPNGTHVTFSLDLLRMLRGHLKGALADSQTVGPFSRRPRPCGGTSRLTPALLRIYCPVFRLRSTPPFSPEDTHTHTRHRVGTPQPL